MSREMLEQQEIYGKEYGYYENELKKAGIHVLVNGSEEIPGKRDETALIWDGDSIWML